LIVTDSCKRFRDLLHRRESVHGCRLVPATGPQFSGRETRLIGGVWKMLRLHAERGAPRVSPAFTLKFSVEEIASVELKTRLRRKNLHYTTRFRVGHFGGAFQTGVGIIGTGAIQHPVVVVSTSEDQLFILLFDPLSNRLCTPK